MHQSCDSGSEGCITLGMSQRGYEAGDAGHRLVGLMPKGPHHFKEPQKVTPVVIYALPEEPFQCD
jgi:hypothetical protein